MESWRTDRITSQCFPADCQATPAFSRRFAKQGEILRDEVLEKSVQWTERECHKRQEKGACVILAAFSSFRVFEGVGALFAVWDLLWVLIFARGVDDDWICHSIRWWSGPHVHRAWRRWQCQSMPGSDSSSHASREGLCCTQNVRKCPKSEVNAGWSTRRVCVPKRSRRAKYKILSFWMLGKESSANVFLKPWWFSSIEILFLPLLARHIGYWLLSPMA